MGQQNLIVFKHTELARNCFKKLHIKINFFQCTIIKQTFPFSEQTCACYIWLIYSPLFLYFNILFYWSLWHITRTFWNNKELYRFFRFDSSGNSTFSCEPLGKIEVKESELKKLCTISEIDHWTNEVQSRFSVKFIRTILLFILKRSFILL